MRVDRLGLHALNIDVTAAQVRVNSISIQCSIQLKLCSIQFNTFFDILGFRARSQALEARGTQGWPVPQGTRALRCPDEATGAWEDSKNPLGKPNWGKKSKFDF